MAGSSKKLEIEVFAIIRPGLEHMGFRKRAGRIFTRELSPDILGAVSFAARLERAGVAVDMSANVGVRFQRLERILAELAGLPYDSYNPDTIFTALLALMPKSRRLQWSFDNTKPVRPEAESLLAAICDYGLPYIENHATLDAVIEAGYRLSKSESLAYRLPMALMLTGRAKEARQAVAGRLSSIDSRTDPAAGIYRTFAARFLDRLASSAGGSVAPG